jgi:quercetin dioxygenase-like cupin family protein
MILHSAMRMAGRQTTRRRRALLLGLIALGATTCAGPVDHAGTRVTKLLEATTTTAGQPIRYPSGAPVVTLLDVVIDAGSETGWHVHPVHGFAFVLSGTLEVDTEGAATRRYAAGQSVAEAVDIPHNGRAVGTEPVRLLMWFAGTALEPFTTPVGDPRGDASP